MLTPVPRLAALDYAGENPWYEQCDRDGAIDSRLGLSQVSFGVMGRNMVCMEIFVLVLIHRASHNEESTERLQGKQFPDHKVTAFSLYRSINGLRVFAFRGFTPYLPTSFGPMDHKT
ncbi:hypothetical protein TNCV_760751 [Trichonephila clavipes]|nr:hypothetical protein TNCV_760751 [Trichonephila clavipes]